MSTDKSVWPSLVGKRVRMGHTEGMSDGTLAYSRGCETYRAGSGPWKAIENIRSIEPLEEPFVPGMWFELNDHRYVRQEHRWRSATVGWPIDWSDGNVRELVDNGAVSVHKPETPVVMVKCHVPDGKYLGQELPEHMKGKDLRVIPESAIVMEDSMPPHMQQGQTYPWLAVTSSKLKFGQGKVYRIIVIEDREALGGNGA